MLTGEMSENEIAELLVEISKRGETVAEIHEVVSVMKELCVPVKGHEDAIDNCGTGGSGLPRINTSTIAAFVLAAGGVKVAKHGNRSSGGRCGSFDVLEALGVKIELDANQVEKMLDEMALGFMFAPMFHPAMKNVASVRKRLGIRTIFNIAGPLVNPANVKRQVVGVSDSGIATKMIDVLKRLGHERAMVVYGEDGLDEITVAGDSSVCDLNKGEISFSQIVPQEILPISPGGDVNKNAKIFMSVLNNTAEQSHFELVCLNAAAGFVVAGKVENVEEGVVFAREILSSGAALDKFNEYVSLTNKI